MDHPLDDCRLKIARAKEQFDSLHAEIVKFDKTNPYVLDCHVDPETGDETIKCAEPPSFPRRWGVIVSEIAQHLRSSLDYLVGVLIEEAGGKPNGDTAFPISKTKTRYLRKNKRGVTYRDRKLRGVPGPLKARIDGFQPFKRGDLAHADMLLALSDFANRDKHRSLRPAYAWINTPTRAFSFPTDDELKDLEIRVTGDGGFKIQTEFKHGFSKPLALVMYPNVKVQGPPGVEVVFGREDAPGEMLGMKDLRDLILYVESVVESFAGGVEGAAGAQSGPRTSTEKGQA